MGETLFLTYNVHHLGVSEFDFRIEFEEFIKLGYDINETDGSGCNLLMLLINLGYQLRYLISHKCNVNANDKCGRTALHHVLIPKKNGSGKDVDHKCECIKILIDSGANIFAKDRFNKIAFQYVYKPQDRQVEYLCCMDTYYRQHLDQLQLKSPLQNTFIWTKFNQVIQKIGDLFSKKRTGGDPIDYLSGIIELKRRRYT